MRVAVLGAAGRMGSAIVRVLTESSSTTSGATLAAAIGHAKSAHLGMDAGQLAGVRPAGVAIAANLPARGAADVWIDFSTPSATLQAAAAAAEAGAALVIGTTGLGASDKQKIASFAARIPIVLSPNTSVGVNVLLKLVADAARLLGPDFDLEIVETHHRAKRDAPSGTALRLAEALAEATERDLGAAARYERHGDVGPRSKTEIGIQTLRGGDVVGDHTVHFLGMGERVAITHQASSRETFARGAVRAALWIAGKPPGLYDMRDVLALR